MKKYINYFALPAIALGLVACEPEFDNDITDADTYTSGEANFSNYVAVGNSLTAGYADGALYLTGQQNSYPNIMAQQFELAGGGEFNQPLVNDNLGGMLFNGTQILNNRLVLAADAEGNPGPATLSGTPTTEITNVLSGSFNNYGVPGAKSYHLVAPGYGNAAGVPVRQANPYYVRFASDASATVIGDAVAENPTFFSLWIGNNDILGFATSGGTGVDQTGNFDPSTYGSNDITDPNVFASVYAQEVAALVSTGAKGALVNIPDVTSVPFFTTVPVAPLDPTSPSFGPLIPTLNDRFGLINQAFAFLGVPERSIVFNTDAASAVVIRDESMVDISAQLTQVLIGGGLDAGTATIFGMQYGQARQANSTDLITLTSSSVIGTVNQVRFAELVGMGLPAETAGQLAVNGVTFPLEDQYTLTANEQALVSNAQTQYNATIMALAEANELAYVDARSELQTVAQAGVPYIGGILTSTYVTGGAFSLDGVHPSPRGYAFTANAIIDAINFEYGSNVPRVNIGNYATVTISNDVN